MSGLWEGYWQVLHEDAEAEIVQFRNTTTAVRSALGFSVFAGGHFLELRSTAPRTPPEDWPPAREEAIAMLRAFRAFAGRSTWREDGNRWVSESEISWPRIPGSRAPSSASSSRRRARLLAAKGPSKAGTVTETWRRLGGVGDTPLAGAWESGDPADLWMYLVTQGHYGVIRTSSARPRTPANGEAFSDDEMFALWEGFGANAGARLEPPEASITGRCWVRWPDTRSESTTFRLITVEDDRFVAVLPPYEDADEGWRRIG